MPVPMLPTPPPALPPALPPDLCFKDHSHGQIEIMPVMLNRAEQWINDLYIGDSFKPVITVKKRRAAMITSKQKTRQQLQEPKSARKRKRKAKDHETEIQNAIYWAPVEIESAIITDAFIHAMAVNPRNRSREEERIIDTYWTDGMSLDPILKTETIDETHAYLKHGKRSWKAKDYVDRCVEDGDLDGIDDASDTLTARATKYRKIASTTSTHNSATRTTWKV